MGGNSLLLLDKNSEHLKMLNVSQNWQTFIIIFYYSQAELVQDEGIGEYQCPDTQSANLRDVGGHRIAFWIENLQTQQNYQKNRLI